MNLSNGQTRRRNRLRRKWIKEIHPVGVIKHKDLEEINKKIQREKEDISEETREETDSSRKKTAENIIEDQRPLFK